MDEVIRKRVIGAAILIIIGIALPVLLSRCIHAPSGEDQAMRVYEIQPSGDIEPVTTWTRNGAADSADKAPTPAGTPADNSASNAPETIAAATLASESDHAATTQAQTQPQTQPQSQPQPASQPQSQPPADEVESAAAAEQTEPAGSEQTQASEQGLEDSAPSGAWVVQVASFPSEKDARAMAEQLGEAYAVFYTSAKVNGDTWYRVRIGPFDTGAAAKNAAAELRAQGRDTLVVQVD